MRRPALCGGGGSADGAEAPGQQVEGALSRVRRLLSGSLPGRNRGRCATFGVRLEELVERSDARDGVPFAVTRLSAHIEEQAKKQLKGLELEAIFRSSADHKLVEKLRLAFDRSGDADLETCADAVTATALLKLWLRELPEPAVPESTTADLLQAVQGSRGDAGPELRKALAAMPDANRLLVRHLAAFLRRVTNHEPQGRVILGTLLAPSLFRQRGQQQAACSQLTARLIADFPALFPDAGMHPASAAEQSEDSHAPQVPRKRKERHESAGSSQVAQDRKVIRSNSQERPSEGAPPATPVSSEAPCSDVEPPAAETDKLLPLHEHNSGAPMEDEEEAEHERRRSSERFASYHRPSAPRTGGSNRRFHQPRRQRRESKENQHEQPQHRYQQPRHAEDSCEDNASHPFLQLHPQEERERSPSPATPRHVAPPLLDLSTLHQQVLCDEPLPSSQAPHHRVPEESHVLLSPRNSMILTRRLDPNVAPSPPVEHVSRRRESNDEGRAKQLTKQLNNLKKKIKLFEEQFETQNGFRPSHADKLANRDLKKMFSELNRLRKELKQVKEESTAPVTNTVVATEPEDGLAVTLREVERRLQEKRDEAERPVELEQLSREQLQAEKVALQKALLHLESLHGRPSSRVDRDLVRPLYDRYRTLKRLVVRSGGSKLRDSMSELATILEHEAMDFITTEVAKSEVAEEETESQPEQQQQPEEEEETPRATENLHALPLSELLKRQQEARDEKKRLRRLLREFEEQFQQDTGRRLQREDREPRQQDYASYKATKARLRLLEALLAKHSTQIPRSC